jgi:8-amino-7-oxononanoate synthase
MPEPHLPLPLSLQKRLEKVQLEGTFRSLPKPFTGVDFTSNDYLGLAQDGKNIQFTSSLEGSMGSRLLQGNLQQILDLEKEAALLFQSEATLWFSSGYQANLAVMSSIPQKGDIILFDQECHASLKDGMRLSLAHKFGYKHLDYFQLEKKLKLNRIKFPNAQLYVVSESLFSMSGKWSDPNILDALCEQNGAYLIYDEAHSTGVVGDNGGGWFHYHLPNKTALSITYTFGKAPGFAGAFVAGSQRLINYLINFARPFIYTTAPPNLMVEATRWVIHKMAMAEDRRLELQEKLAFFYAQFGKTVSAPISPIIPIPISGISGCKEVAQQLQNQGFNVKAILPPTVLPGTERLRINITALHTYEELRNLAEALKPWWS